jgi:hypothetical protein
LHTWSQRIVIDLSQQKIENTEETGERFAAASW